MKKIKKVTTVILAFLVFLLTLPMSVNIAAATVETGEVNGKTYILGDQLYYTDFEEATEGSLPTGWEISYTKSWCYNGGSNVGTATVATLGSAGKVLTYGANGVDTFLSMPEIKTRNYVYEVQFLIAAGCKSGSFGIANGMYDGISNATGAVFTSVPVTASPGGSGPYYRSKGKPSVQKVDFTVPDKTTSGTWIKMKFVSLDGENHFYFNEKYIGTYAQGESDSTSDWLGAYTYNGTFHITEVKVTEIIKSELDYNNVELSVDNGTVSINTEFSFNKANKLYKNNISGNYSYSDTAAIKFGVLYSVSDSVAVNNITISTDGVTDNLFTSLSQTKDKLYFNCKIAVPTANLDKFYELRPYILIGSEYFYGKAQSYSAARLANAAYSKSDDSTKVMLSSAFASSSSFKGENINTLTFTLFSDFHYKENMYTVSIADLRTILQRADDSNSAFIMSGGDFCNDFAGSPELTNTYLNYTKADGTTLTAYNIYGNHELETAGNSMDNVTATLTNDKNVIWGTADGNFDSNIGYYYFENNGFRIVCVDTNYSLNSSGAWEHNLPASYGAASGNTKTNSLGDVQLAWLESVLTDAANNGIPCIVVSHDGFSGKFATSSSDAKAVREIYARVNAIKAGTVIMSINGHHHTNHQGYNDGVFYFDMNTTRNGYWYNTGGVKHYSADDTYIYEQYDDEGNLVDSYERPVNDLYQAKNTWFFNDPVSAVVTVDEFGTVTIDGYESSWMYDVKPDTSASGVEPKVTSGTFWDCNSLGHIWSEHIESDSTHHWYSCENPACPVKDVSLNKGYEAHSFEEIEDDKFLVGGYDSTYYKSCSCGALSLETFGEGVVPPQTLNVWDGSIADSYSGGDGSADSPYLIENAEQLARMIGYDVLTNYSGNTSNGSTDKHYKLVNDIYINDVSTDEWYNGDGLNCWYSATSSRFCGSLDGNGYTVYGLYFESDATNAGLIPVIDAYHNERYIKNITVSDSYIVSSSMSGAIASRVYSNNSKPFYIDNCYVTDSVIVDSTATGSYVGGLIGFSTTGNATPITVSNTACLAKNADGSSVKYGVVATTFDWSGEYYITIENSFIYCEAFQSLTFKGSIKNSYTVSELTGIKGSTAKTIMPDLEGFCFTENYPVNIGIAQLRGDANCDGKGNAADLTNYRQYLIIGKSVAVSDINADGESDIRDLVNIKRKLADRA